MSKPKLYYHFTNGTLRNGDPIPPIGEWLNPLDALAYASGCTLHLVQMGSRIESHGDPVDKVVSNRRKILASRDAESLCREFARRCALDVLPLWPEAPKVVVEYLTRAAARDADAAPWAAAWGAAWGAAWAASAASAARGAAWAARAAARAAARDKYRGWFLEMVNALFEKEQVAA